MTEPPRPTSFTLPGVTEALIFLGLILPVVSLRSTQFGISSATDELILICFTGKSDNLVLVDQIGILDFGINLKNGF
mgnify:CR=1 FL=1